MKDNVIVVNFTNKDKNKFKRDNKKPTKPSILSIIVNKVKKLFSTALSFITKKSLNSPYKNRYKNRYK